MTRPRAYPILALLLLTLAAYAGAPPDSAHDAVTTIVVVRHAEKASTSDDPPLSEAGRARALALARLLSDSGVTALAATPYRRTRETLEPLALLTNVEIEVRPVDLSDPQAYARSEAAWLLGRHRDETVVVAGHSNTVPLLLAALGFADPPPIDDDRYDDLFMLFLGPGEARRMLHLHYGDPSP